VSSTSIGIMLGLLIPQENNGVYKAWAGNY
jgi:hypothetical protein